MKIIKIGIIITILLFWLLALLPLGNNAVLAAQVCGDGSNCGQDYCLAIDTFKCIYQSQSGKCKRETDQTQPHYEACQYTAPPSESCTTQSLLCTDQSGCGDPVPPQPIYERVSCVPNRCNLCLDPDQEAECNVACFEGDLSYNCITDYTAPDCSSACEEYRPQCWVTVPDPTPTDVPPGSTPTPTPIPTSTPTPTPTGIPITLVPPTSIPTPTPTAACIPGGSVLACTTSPDNCCSGFACTFIGFPVWGYRCAAAPTTTPTPIPPTPTPTSVTVSGNVYYDPNKEFGGLTKCTGPTNTNIPNGLSVLVNPGGGTANVVSNAYSIANVVALGLKTISLQSLPGTYQCTCPTGCQYGSVNLVANGGSGWNFYVTDLLAKWWQVLWGDVHAQSGFTANVPASNYLLVDAPSSGGPGVATANDKNNIAVNGGGSLSSSGNKYNDGISSTNWRYSYQSLWEKAGRPTTALPNGGSGKPAPCATGTCKYLVSGADLTISGNWNNLSGRTMIFADQNVIINTEISGGYLAIIAKGNITVGSGVKRNGAPKAASTITSADAQLSGAFWADGNFTVDEDVADETDQLIIYGSVAAGMDLSGNVIFNRNLGQNNDKPPVAVIWNPFLVLNAPEELKDAYMDWKEVAP